MLIRTAWALLGLTLAVALGLIPAAAQDSKADIRGMVTNVSAANEEAKKKGTLGSILVEGAKEKDTTFDKASIRVTDKTKIEKLVGKERKPAKFDDLKKGAKVQALFTGPVAESYPVQAMAKEILILEEAK
jgi:beta-N-acetylhexosaminidase